MKLSDNESITISIDESVPCLEWIGKKRISSEEFRDSEQKSLQFYLRYKTKYPRLEWFVDARNVGVLTPEDIQWVIDRILPKFASAGLKKEAFVVPSSAIGKIIIRNYVSKAGDIIEIKSFDNSEAAKNWLKQ